MTQQESPWVWHSQWKQGIAQAEEESIGYHWLFAAAWIVAVQFLGPADFWKHPFQLEGHEWSWITAWLCQVGGVVLVFWAAWSQISKKRFGATVLHLDTLPGIPGQVFRGTLTIPRLPTAPPPAVVAGSCIQITHNDSRGGSKRKVLWKHEATAVLAQDASSGWQLSISLPLPQGQPDTQKAASASNNLSHSIRWQISVQIPLPGMDFKRTYFIPVYRL